MFNCYQLYLYTRRRDVNMSMLVSKKKKTRNERTRKIKEMLMNWFSCSFTLNVRQRYIYTQCLENFKRLFYQIELLMSHVSNKKTLLETII